MTSQMPPTRQEVTARWQAVADGSLDREEVSAWAEPLMLAQYESPPDVLVMQALQYLNGFDMTYRSVDRRRIGHGPPGEYVRTLAEVQDEFRAWSDRCRAYDAYPAGWIAERRRQAAVARRGSDESE
jgi:hypothetical protein